MTIFLIVFIALAAILIVPLAIIFVVGGLALLANVLARVLVWWKRDEASQPDVVPVAEEPTQTLMEPSE
jgi:uncharacterized iron-regulated membrane protein